MPEPMIVKAQLSLFSSGGNSEALVYNEERTIHYQTSDPMEIDAVMAKLNGAFKGYFYAEVDEDGLVILGDVAPEQEW